MKTDYKDKIFKPSTGETNEDRYTQKPDIHERIVIQNVSFENETRAFTYVRVGIDRSGSIIWLAEEKSPALGTLYWYDKDIFLYFGERLIVRFNGTISGDKLAVYPVGYREPTGIH